MDHTIYCQIVAYTGMTSRKQDQLAAPECFFGSGGAFHDSPRAPEPGDAKMSAALSRLRTALGQRRKSTAFKEMHAKA